MQLFITLALMKAATVYGYGEKNCGNPGKAVACRTGAITASGQMFDPTEISAAVPAPKNNRIRLTHIWVKAYNNACIKLKINDKKNWRYIGKSGLDLTPAAVMAITGKLPSKSWSGKLEMCKWF
jgi:hypothetical protein